MRAPSADTQPGPPAPGPARPARSAAGSSLLQGLAQLLSLCQPRPARPLPQLPPDIFREIARRSDPLTVQRLRVASKPVKAAIEADMRELVIKDRAGLAGVLRAGNYPALEKLTLAGTFTDDDLRGLPASLKALDLSRCRGPITAAGIAHLSRLPLVRLNVRNKRIGAEGARLLANHPTLTSLNVSNGRIGPEGAQALAANTRLTTLNVSGNRIGVALSLIHI